MSVIWAANARHEYVSHTLCQGPITDPVNPVFHVQGADFSSLHDDHSSTRWLSLVFDRERCGRTPPPPLNSVPWATIMSPPATGPLWPFHHRRFEQSSVRYYGTVCKRRRTMNIDWLPSTDGDINKRRCHAIAFAYMSSFSTTERRQRTIRQCVS
jgi:hypothetical protein